MEWIYLSISSTKHDTLRAISFVVVFSGRVRTNIRMRNNIDVNVNLCYTKVFPIRSDNLSCVREIIDVCRFPMRLD